MCQFYIKYWSQLKCCFYYETFTILVKACCRLICIKILCVGGVYSKFCVVFLSSSCWFGISFWNIRFYGSLKIDLSFIFKMDHVLCHSNFLVWIFGLWIWVSVMYPWARLLPLSFSFSFSLLKLFWIALSYKSCIPGLGCFPSLFPCPLS